MPPNTTQLMKSIAYRPVACRYERMEAVYGNVEVVAPTSAPMLLMVAKPEKNIMVYTTDGRIKS